MSQPTTTSVSGLRALTYRIASTPTEQLPYIAPQIAGCVWNYRDILSSPVDAKQNNETATAVHRFKTQIATLLQDRTLEGRWAALVLTKATIEAGQLEVLSKCNPWVKSLLAILKRPDPPTTRILAVLTLTRIFTLTWDYANLIHVITTPALTSFVPTCISNIENKRCSPEELQAVLDAFALLLPRHPTIFRNSEDKLRSILVTVISSTSVSRADRYVTDGHRATAREILVLWHHCERKQGSGDKWSETLKKMIEAAHSTCDLVLRSVHEDWQSLAGIQPSLPNQRLMSGDVEIDSEDAAKLKPWKGIYAGSERLISLLQLLGEHLTSTTSTNVSVRLGILTDLLTRLFGVVSSPSGKQDFVKINNQISRDERDAMFAVLPQIHVAAVHTSIAILKRFGTAAVSIGQTLFDQVLFVFRAEKNNPSVRQAIFQLCGQYLALFGPSMAKNDVSEINPVLKAACQDILGDEYIAAANGSSGGINQQLGLPGGQTAQSYPTDVSELTEAARNLIKTALLKLDAAMITPSLRAQMDRRAVFARDEEMLLASVMNPPKKSGNGRTPSSLLPILAREYGDSLEAEMLLRPRMPTVYATAQRDAAVSSAENMDDDDEQDEEEANSEHSADIFESFEEDTSADVAVDAAAAEADPDTTALSEHASTKRRALDEIPQETSAKRLRASPEAGVPQSESASLLGPESMTLRSNVPKVLVEPKAVQRTTQASVQAQQSSLGLPEQSGGQGEEDDSDFEMPPLTMEQDTEPEDEDEDDS